MLTCISIKFNKLLVLLCVMCFFINYNNAQVFINVKNTSKEPVIDAMVSLKKNDSLISEQMTDKNGQVIINQKSGNYLLSIQSYSFEKTQLNLQISNKEDVLDVILKKTVVELEELLIKKNKLTKSQKIRESLYAPEAIALTELKSSSKTIVEAINLVPGLRIQQQGGMGSELNVNLNGIDGKDVRLFVDEIPVYLLGRGFDLKNLTVNMIERIEIYKGLVPIHFGSDALGGVINIVTVKNKKNVLGAGYSYGSWGANEATLNTFLHPVKNKKFFAGFDAVYRHSDNNYWMDEVDIVVDELNNTKKGRARRFNDEYDFGLFKIQTGFEDLSWADTITFISSFTYTNKEWQHGITALQPWGEPFSEDYTAGFAINWKKSDFKNKKWNLAITTGYNFEQSYFEDISPKIYFWDGNFVDGYNKGESGFYSQGRTPKINQNVFYARENISYKIAYNYKINLNLFTTKRELTGEDNAGTATYKKDPFKVPQNLINNFAGTSFEAKFLNNRLVSNTSFKHYYNSVQGVNFKINNEFDKVNSSSSSDIGFGQVFKWMITPNITIIPGYEHAVRQPDNIEVFGDYITISPNPNLKSAKSDNANLKLQFKSINRKVFMGFGGFYRNTKNRIIITSLTNALSSYTNLLQTSTIGGECFFEYKLNSKIDLSFNATYLDTRLSDVDDLGIFTKEYIGARIPNTPYLFGNAQASYVFVPKNKNYSLRFLYTSSYVNEYFLTWALNGIKSSKVTIPSQFINDISISIHSKKKRLSFAIDCKNITNARLYDNFSVQKAGRSFYGKVNYSLIN